MSDSDDFEIECGVFNEKKTQEEVKKTPDSTQAKETNKEGNSKIYILYLLKILFLDPIFKIDIYLSV